MSSTRIQSRLAALEQRLLPVEPMAVRVTRHIIGVGDDGRPIDVGVIETLVVTAPGGSTARILLRDTYHHPDQTI